MAKRFINSSLLIALFSLQFLILYTHAGPIQQRANDGCSEIDEASTWDGPTADRSAGIGVEFECNRLLFQADNDAVCPAEIYPLKGKVISGRTGTNWEFTGILLSLRVCQENTSLMEELSRLEKAW